MIQWDSTLNPYTQGPLPSHIRDQLLSSQRFVMHSQPEPQMGYSDVAHSRSVEYYLGADSHLSAFLDWPFELHEKAVEE